MAALIEKTSGNAAFAVVSLQNLSELSGQTWPGGSNSGAAGVSGARGGFAAGGGSVDGTLSSDKICVVFDQLMDDNHVLLAGLKIERAFEEPLLLAEEPWSGST